MKSLTPFSLPRYRMATTGLEITFQSFAKVEGNFGHNKAAFAETWLKVPVVIVILEVRFLMYRDAMHSRLLIKLMTRVIQDAGRKVFLIPDVSDCRNNHPVCNKCC